MQKDIFNIQNEAGFTEVALAVFKHQFQTNRVYRSFCDLINVHPSDVQKVSDIPFLPIQFFKSRKVLASREEVQEIFTSSGTTGSRTSKHFVTDIKLYKDGRHEMLNETNKDEVYSDLLAWSIKTLQAE